MSSPNAKTAKLAGSLWLAGMGLALFGVGAVFSWLLWGAYQRETEARGWREVSGEIIVSRVIQHDVPGEAEPRYSAEVQYRYECDGKTFTNDTVRLKKRAPGQEDVAEDIVLKYPPAARLPVYVDPRDSSRAVLEQGSRGALFAEILPLLIAAGGLGMLFNAIRGLVRRA